MSDVSTAFDFPWIEPVEGAGDVTFARADADYWGQWADQVKKQRVAADLAKLQKLPILDPIRRMDAERKIEDAPVYLGEVIDRQHTPDGLKKIILDSLVRGGKALPEAEGIRKRIGIGRQMQLASIICSEPQPTIEQYRDAVRKLCLARGMSQEQVSRLVDADLIRLAAEAPPAPPKMEGEQSGPLSEGRQSQIDTPG